MITGDVQVSFALSLIFMGPVLELSNSWSPDNKETQMQPAGLFKIFWKQRSVVLVKRSITTLRDPFPGIMHAVLVLMNN